MGESIKTLYNNLLDYKGKLRYKLHIHSIKKTHNDLRWNVCIMLNKRILNPIL